MNGILWQIKQILWYVLKNAVNFLVAKILKMNI